MDIRRLVAAAFALGAIGIVAGAAYVISSKPAPPAKPPAEADEPAEPKEQEAQDGERVESYVVAPVAEPEWPNPDDATAVTRGGYAPFPGGYQYDVKQDDGRRRSGVVVAGRFLLDRGLLEFLGCSEGGKEHESVVRLEADIQALDQALQLCGLRRGQTPSKLGSPEEKQGSRVVVLLQWKKDGQVVTHRAEDLVLVASRRGPMPRVGFTYVGTWADLPDPTSVTNKETVRVLAATLTRAIITTYRDDPALLDCPLEDAREDAFAGGYMFGANFMLLPEPGTPVNVIIRPPTEAESREIAALERELVK